MKINGNQWKSMDIDGNQWSLLKSGTGGRMRADAGGSVEELLGHTSCVAYCMTGDVASSVVTCGVRPFSQLVTRK